MPPVSQHHSSISDSTDRAPSESRIVRARAGTRAGLVCCGQLQGTGPWALHHESAGVSSDSSPAGVRGMARPVPTAFYHRCHSARISRCPFRGMAVLQDELGHP